MPIIVKHSGSPGLAATAAFGAGQGARIQQLEDERLKMLQRQNEMQAQQSFAAKQAELGREFSADQAGLGREFSAEQAGLGREFQSGQAETAARRAQEIQQQNIEFNYSAKQRAEFNADWEAFAEAEKSGTMTPEELTDAKRQIQAKHMGMKPHEIMKKAEPTLQGRKVGETWSEGGWLNTVESDRFGTLKIKKLGEDKSQPTMKDKLDAYKYAQEALKGLDDKPADPAAVKKWVEDFFSMASSIGKPQMGPPEPEGPDELAFDADAARVTPNNVRLLTGQPVAKREAALKQMAGIKSASEPVVDNALDIAQKAPVEVKTPKDYASIPSGTVYLGPDGKKRRKM